MANLIQIKRSLTSGTPGSLANGELAFTANGDILFIGSPNGSVVPIAGARTPGILTANQALVANTTSGIDKILVANLVPTQIYANGGFGTTGQILASNGSSLYWATPTAGVSGSNTQIQFNDSGILAGDSDFTFNKDTNTLTVGTATINSTAFSGTANNANNLGGVAAASYQLNSTLAANVATLTANNATNLGGLSAASYQTTAGLAANDATLTANNADNLGGISAASYQTTAGLAANVATLTANNATNLNGQAASYYTNATNLSSGTVATARLGSGTANSTTFLSGDQSYKTAVTSVTSGNGLSGGPISTTGTLSVQAGAGIIANSSGTFVNAGTGVTVNSTGVHIGQAVGTTSGVTFGTLNVSGNSAFGDAASDVVSINGRVNTDIIPTANVTYGLGNNTVRWSQVHVANVHSVTGKFDGDVEIAGSLTVTGSVSNVNVVDLVVSDPLIHLASNNETSDIVDIGFVGHYSDDGGTTKRHIGLFRDATDGVFKLFTNLVQSDLDTSNATTVNTAIASYQTAFLETYLISGALSTNATTIAITANSTVNVAIVANTLTLSTALTGVNGGTGLSSTTNNALLVGNSTNGFSQLTLGTAGYVLQSNGTALVYDVLDGGTF